MRQRLARLTDFDARLFFMLTVFVLFLVSFFVYVNAERAIDTANTKRLQSFLLADELRQSSDDLTRMVRTYAVTGEPRYRQHFDEIFAIRNGDAPKPENYHYIYWDLVDATNTRPRSFGSPVALLNTMRQVGFTDIELAQLVFAKQASDDLTNIEQRAMELVASGDPELREQALMLLHNDEYHLAKAGIMRPIDTLYEMMSSRTADAVRKAEIYARWLRLVFVILGLTLLLMLWQLKQRQLAILGAPVAELYSRIEALGNGDFNTDIVVPVGKDNTLLGWLSRTRHRLFLLEHTRMQVQQRLEHLAHYDPLTGLSNRVLLAEQLQKSMLNATQNASLLAVAFVDIDGFKAVNDRFGHALGDQVLQTLSKRLVAAVGKDNIVARMSGDEFVFLLNTLAHVEDSQLLLQQVLDSLAVPMTIDGTTIALSASIGVSFYPQNADVAAEQLLRQADQAMYVAKQAGKNKFHLFDNEADSHTRVVLRSLNDIRDGLARQEFLLFYQPKINMRTGECTGIEALIRWQHPVQGLMAPGQFLPLIEHHELGVQLGQWVISQAFRQYQAWQTQGIATAISVNIAAFHLQQADFFQQLQVIFDNFPAVPPSMLELEIVEAIALQDTAHVKKTMESCSALGVTFSLDDFGTGYSSLSYLKRLPISTLKLDQSFVRDILTDADDLAILQGVSRLAEAFELATIAEGVETAAHMQKLLDIGYVFGQGYGIARPMPASTFANWLSKWDVARLS